MSNTLQKLSTEYRMFIDVIKERDGVLDEELEAVFDSLNLSIDQKIEGTIKHTKNIEGNISLIDAEIIRLQQMKKAQTNTLNWFKSNLKRCMETAEIREKDFTIFKAWIQKNPPSAEIIDEALIPERFIITIPESYKVDKKAVLDALKKGEEVGGAKLINNKTNLRIK